MNYDSIPTSYPGYQIDQVTCYIKFVYVWPIMHNLICRLFNVKWNLHKVIKAINDVLSTAAVWLQKYVLGRYGFAYHTVRIKSLWPCVIFRLNTLEGIKVIIGHIHTNTPSTIICNSCQYPCIRYAGNKVKQPFVSDAAMFIYVRMSLRGICNKAYLTINTELTNRLYWNPP